MADISKFIPTLIKHEGGYVNDPADPGGATKWGVTINTWRKLGYDKDGDGDIDENDIKLLEVKDVIPIIKISYWDKLRADEIKNQSIAEICVDWIYNSGTGVIKNIQKLLGLEPDGIVGKQTLEFINSHDQKELHERILIARHNYYQTIIAKNPKLKKFEKGWLKRLYSYKFVI